MCVFLKREQLSLDLGFWPTLRMCVFLERESTLARSKVLATLTNVCRSQWGGGFYSMWSFGRPHECVYFLSGDYFGFIWGSGRPYDCAYFSSGGSFSSIEGCWPTLRICIFLKLGPLRLDLGFWRTLLWLLWLLRKGLVIDSVSDLIDRVWS